MNALILSAIICILYSSGGILTIRIPFSKILKTAATNIPFDIEWPTHQLFVSYANNTNDTVKVRKYQDTSPYFTPYNLAMLFE
jgi:hypothetical protein